MDAHVWIGSFSSDDALHTYLEESYDDDDTPISSFARDQGEVSYDHDWLERHFESDQDVNVLLDRCFSAVAAVDVLAATDAVALPRPNTLLTMGVEDGGIGHPRSVETSDHALSYLGVFQSL